MFLVLVHRDPWSPYKLLYFKAFYFDEQQLVSETKLNKEWIYLNEFRELFQMFPWIKWVRLREGHLVRIQHCGILTIEFNIVTIHFVQIIFQKSSVLSQITVCCYTYFAYMLFCASLDTSGKQWLTWFDSYLTSLDENFQSRRLLIDSLGFLMF